jgi:hypothetical protein
MKKLILAISLVAAVLFSTTSCDIDVNVTVNAYAELMDLGSDVPVPTQTLSFGPFTHTYLSEPEVESIFLTLIKNSSKNFTAADLFLQYVDNIVGTELKMEHYGVVVQGDGRFEFILMDSQ